MTEVRITVSDSRGLCLKLKHNHDSNMDNNMEERLVEEVRRYENLYNPSTTAYKDAQMTANSWKEISAAVGLDVPECIKTWRRIRDKFVRLKKTTKGNSGDAGG